MTIYKNKKGTPTYKARKGLQAARTAMQREALVRQGKASPWLPLRTLDGAIERAGL